MARIALDRKVLDAFEKFYWENSWHGDMFAAPKDGTPIVVGKLDKDGLIRNIQTVEWTKNWDPNGEWMVGPTQPYLETPTHWRPEATKLDYPEIEKWFGMELQNKNE